MILEDEAKEPDPQLRYQNQEIIQCHRAFIVNTNKIISAKGNSQGLRLSLENCNNEVPVSRNYVDLVRSSN